MEMDVYLRTPDSDNYREDEINHDIEGLVQNAWEHARDEPMQAQFVEPNLDGANREYSTEGGIEGVNHDGMQGADDDDEHDMDGGGDNEDIGGSNDEDRFGHNAEELEVGDDDDFEAGVDPIDLELKWTLKHKLINLQSEWDEQCISRKYQGKLLGHIFGNLRRGEDDNLVPPSEQTFGEVFRRMPPTWKGEIAGHVVPSSWRNLMTAYKKWGLGEPSRWRMCVGTENNIHDAVLLQPSDEDVYEGNNILSCSCNPPENIRDCIIHGAKCFKCERLRKHLIPFDYFPIARQLSTLMRSRKKCEQMLTMWKRENRERWLGKGIANPPNHIKEIWDGEKLCQYQDFWNPEVEWELPVSCGNEDCKMIFRAFPELCADLEGKYNCETRMYEFICSNCNTEISSPKVTV